MILSIYFSTYEALEVLYRKCPLDQLRVIPCPSVSVQLRQRVTKAVPHLIYGLSEDA